MTKTGKHTTNKSLQLAQETVALLQTRGSKLRVICGPTSKACPADPSQLAQLAASVGRPLPPSLLCWLAFDGQALGILDDHGSLRTTTLRQFMKEELAAAAEELDDEEFDEEEALEAVLDARNDADLPAIRLPDSASQAFFLVLNGSLEPPVLAYEREEFWQAYDSFGVYVASVCGELSAEDD